MYKNNESLKQMMIPRRNNGNEESGGGTYSMDQHNTIAISMTEKKLNNYLN